MKFFMISKCGEGAGLLKRIQDEGNDCRIWIKEPDYHSVYDGILKKTKAYPSVDKDEIVIFDSSGVGEYADSLEKSFGASKFMDKLESDRAFGLEMMIQSGIKIPETYEFKKLEEARQFVKTRKERFVFKPSGDDLPTKLSYVSSDMEDLLRYLDYIEKAFKGEISSFVLQEFIEGAIVSSELWFDGEIAIGSPNHTIEVKKFMNGELGPSTGCSGNIVWPADWNHVIEEGVGRAADFCAKEGYLGPLDLNTIVNEKGIFGLEWTPRFGLDAMPTFLHLLQIDIGKFIADLVHRQLNEVPMQNQIAAGVRVTIPPYPIEPKSAKEIQKTAPNLGIPIRGLELDDDRVYFYEIMQEGGELFHSEGTGVIAVVSDSGDNVESAFEGPMGLLEEAKIPDKQYRTDLAEKLSEMYHEIQKEIECLTL